jgi:hypothetical protein
LWELNRGGARQWGVRRMMLLLFCAAVGLTACARFGGGGVAGGGPSDGKSDDPVSGTPGPEPPGGDGAMREEPDPSVFGPQAAAVDHFTIGANGLTVVVYWWGGNPACFGLREVQIDVQHGTPIITVLEGTREAAGDRMCTMEAVLKSAVVTLDEPILSDAANPDPASGEALLPDEALSVKPVRDVQDPRPHAVSGYALSADGLTLSAYYVGGTEACYGLVAATASRDERGPLVVSVREGRRPDGDAACDDIGVAKVVKLSLDEPLIKTAAFDSEPQQPSS